MITVAGYTICTTTNIGRSETIVEHIRPHPNRGIWVNRKRTIIVANGDFYRNDINKAIYCHPDDKKKLIDAIQKTMET